MSDCTKIPYASRNAATIAMRAIGRKKIARGLKGPIGAYFCGACKHWHLTSKSVTRTPPWEKVQRGRRPRATGAP
jgi:hypothetical protein